MAPLCGACRHLTRTSASQVFLRCEWHSSQPGGDILRCHVQPWADACVHFAPRTDTSLAAILREVRAGVPYAVAVPAVLGGVVS